MAYDEELARRVRALLARRHGVVEKKLMGHLAFMVNGAMCCAVGEKDFLVRVGKDEREEVLANPHDISRRTPRSAKAENFARTCLDLQRPTPARCRALTCHLYPTQRRIQGPAPPSAH